MQCVACNEVFSTEIDACPRCKESDPVQTASSELARPDANQPQEASSSAMTDNPNATPQTTQSAPNSTLLEFPGVSRRPAWRKELSERFREIQQRRAREAALEAGEVYLDETLQAEPEFATSAKAKNSSEATKQLGLVPPPPDEPEMNPIVVAALARVERARAQFESVSAPRSGSGRAQTATAAARVIAEQPEQFKETDPKPANTKRKSARADKPETGIDATRASTLVAVPPKQTAKSEPPAAVEAASIPAPDAKATVKTKPATVEASDASPVVQTSAQPSVAATQTESAKPQPRHIAGVIDEFWLERQGIELLPKVAAPDVIDDRAPRAKRLVAGLFDLVAVAFLSAPFAAIIELSIGNWNDPRVSGSMSGIVLVVMFLYNFCSVALAGRTPGLSLCSLQIVDARTASVPTTGQCIRRALVYMISLATFGLGILYSIFDAEGRTAHDLLSGTVVVKK